jgi:pseudouridine-5'-phosphate glycosidase
MWQEIMDIKANVKKAIDEGRPIVALESTIISHGMPYPKNVETARALEKIIEDAGAVAATIAIIDGRIKVGLDDEILEVLGTSNEVEKVSRRDLPEVIAAKKHGATTVAATMLIAEHVGIKVFATGGIGGVHRGYDAVLDISQDLEELARTNVVVVCAGVKAILDIRSTLEYLETRSVPVYIIGEDEFPAFYSRSSGIFSGERVDDLAVLARSIDIKWKMGLSGGVVVANPIPVEADIDSKEIGEVIERALEMARKEGISGKETTPYLLKSVVEMTEGRSLEANIALVKNNARVAAELAIKLI